MKSTLFDFFPVPKSLAMHASGVAVSDDAIRFVRLAYKKAELEAYGEISLPDNVLDGGGVTEPKEFTRVLAEFRKRHNLDLVEVSIPEEKSYLFKTTVLGDNLKEIRSNLDLQIQNNVPFKLSEVVFDFSVTSDANDVKREVVVSVLPRTVVEQYLAVFHNAGFTPISFQVESQAVTQAVVPRENKISVLVINIQGDKVGFYVVTGQTVRFSSTVSIDESYTQINIMDEAPKEEKGEDVLRLSVLVREIKKILTYWRTHDGENESLNIKHLYLTGTIPDEIKVTDYIGNNVALPVEVSNVWQNAFSFDTTIPDMERKDSLRFAASIGLALPNQE